MTTSNSLATTPLSWTIEKNNSIFLKKKLREHVNNNQVLGFIESGMGISFRNIKRYDYMVKAEIFDEQIQMKKYKNLYDRRDNVFSTSVSHSKHGWGRVNPKNHMSLSIMHRPTRHGLAAPFYRDVDMCCAHPQIVLEFCKMHGMEESVSAIKDYTENSKKYRHELMTLHDVKYDVAKQLPIRLMFGGSYASWKKDYDVKDPNHHPLMKSFQTQITAVAEIVYANNSKILKDVLKADPDKWPTLHEKKRGVMAMWCLTLERKIQECAIECVVSNSGCALEDIVPCQDGFMISETHYYDGLEIDCTAAVQQKIGLHMPFLNKPFDEAIEIPLCTITPKSMTDWKKSLTARPMGATFVSLFENVVMKDVSGMLVYVFYDGRWHDETNPKESRNGLMRLVGDELFAIIDREIYADISLKDEERDILSLMLRTNCSETNKINGIIMHALSMTKCMDREFDTDPFKLGFKDGVYNLETGDFRPYVYDDYMLRSTGYNFPGLDLANLTTAQNEVRETLVTIFDDIQPNHDEMRMLMQILASALDGIAYQKIFMFTGKGGNGKGLISNLMSSALGDYFAQPGNGILKDCEKSNVASPDLIGLKGRRYLNFSEVGGILKTTILRNLTGGGKFIGRELYGANITFKMSGTMIMEFNNHPDLDAQPQESDYRRMVEVTFPTIFTTDPNKIGRNIGSCDHKEANRKYTTPDFIEECRPIFLAMLLKTYATFRQNDGSGIRFDIPQSTIAKTAKYLEGQNVFASITNRLFERTDVLLNADGSFNKKDLKLKTFKLKDMWNVVHHDSEYNRLSPQEKRNQYGSAAYVVWLDETYTIIIKKKVKIIIGLSLTDQCSPDEDDDSDDEEDEEEYEAKGLKRSLHELS